MNAVIVERLFATFAVPAVPAVSAAAAVGTFPSLSRFTTVPVTVCIFSFDPAHAPLLQLAAVDLHASGDRHRAAAESEEERR